MNFKNKYIILLLVFIIFIDITGYIIYINITLNNAKIEGKAKISNTIDNHNLEIIILNKEELKSLEYIEINEIKYRGIMYDIYKIIEEDNQLIIYCIKDEKETKLLKHFRDIISNNQSKAQNTNVRNIGLFSIFGILNNLTYQPLDIISNFFFSFDNISIPKVYIIPPSPPPKSIV